ncbi:Ig-like domain-containing protein [Patescibacteria group bacterium]|nr:Ig-like domain-containing protein [Patescibacteria group bacterium]MBU1672964.1 Ig-like domain-containing protein [Patescibacteria group bacterium]MBU1963001.1 Ig-like domain-containing protein [Patescibacteria group bacterium]
MKKRGNSFYAVALIVVMLTVGLSLFLIAKPVSAQVFTDWNIALGSASPLDIIVAIINWGLGILALVAVGIILWGGFSWMTASGDEEKLQKAKNILRNGVIGLVIILAAWAIAAYIINILLGATGAGEGGTGSNVPHDGDNDIVGRFHVDHVNPQADETDVVLCSIVATTFSLPVVQETVLEQSMDTPQDILDAGYQEFENFELYIPNYIDPAGAEQNALYHGDSCSDNFMCRSSNCDNGSCYGNQILGTIEFFESGYGFSFYPLDDYEENTVYRAKFQTGEDGIIGEDEVLAVTYSLSPSDPLYTWQFTTGTETDELPPQVNVEGSMLPVDGETDVCMLAPIQVQFNESMDPASIRSTAIWLYDYAAPGDYNANFSPSLYDMSAARMVTFLEVDDTFISGSEEVLSEFTEYSFDLYSGDPNNNFSGAMRDMCGNPLDGNYNDVSEGHDDTWAGGDDFIDPTSAVTAQPGGGDWSFPWQFTTGDDPVCAPVINTVSPENVPGYYSEAADQDGQPSQADSDKVTVSGRYLAPALDIDLNNNKSAAGPNCFDTNHWVSEGCMLTAAYTELIFRTPAGSYTGPIEVETTTGETTSDTSYSIAAPYVSTTSPYAGPVGQFITVKGLNFGDDLDQAGGEVHFVWDGGTSRIPAEFPCDDSWDNTQIVVRVPEGIPENSSVQVIKPENGNKYSNYTAFELTDEEPGPGLCELVPECSDTGLDAVRAYGENFGPSDNENNIYFDEYEVPAITAWDAFDANDGLDYNYVQASQSPNQDLETYDVKVRSTNDKPLSNGLDFEIPCTPAPEMFFYNGCQVEAGLLYLPMPKFNMNDACPNGLVDFAFTDDMDDASVENSFSIKQCTAEGENCDTELNGALSNAGFLPGEYIGEQAMTNYEKYSFNPTNNLTADTWYRVTVSSTATNNNGTPLVQDYSWDFKVRDTGNCTADYTVLYPYSEIINYHDPIDSCDHEYNGTAYNEECISLSVDTWHWFIDNEVGYEGLDILRFQTGDIDKNKTGANATQVNVCTQGDGADNFGNVTVNAEPLDDNNAAMSEDDSLVVVDFGYCIDDTDCQSVTGCETSTCDLASHHCKPVITDFSPLEAGTGGCVTVNGCYFGPSREGSDYCTCTEGDESCYVSVGAEYCMLPSFSRCYVDPADEEATCQAGNAAPIGDGRLEIPIGSETGYLESDPQCVDTWTNSHVIAEITTSPVGVHPLTITSYYGLDHTTQDTISIIGTPTPCLCLADPDSGEEGDLIDFYGKNFGGSGTASFNGSNNRLSSTPTTWSATSALEGEVPLGAISGYNPSSDPQLPAAEGVFLTINGADSNSVDFGVSCNSDLDCSTGCCSDSGQCAAEEECNTCFDMTDCVEASGCGGDCVDNVCEPVITELSPSSGSEGQPVTVRGCHFGSAANGTVTFNQIPAELGCDGYYPWNNHEIIVRAPLGIFGNNDIEATVLVTRDTGEVDQNNNPIINTSNSEIFAEDNTCEDIIYPELCTLNPNYGTYGATIDFQGYNFRSDNDEYCYCEHPTNSDLNCDVGVNDEYCAVTYDMTLYVDPDFPTQECTEDMDNYNGTDACVAEDVDANDQAVTCDIPLGDTSCDVAGLEYRCYVDDDPAISCTENSPTYLNEGGYAEFSIQKRIAAGDYGNGFVSENLFRAQVPDEAESGEAYMGVITTDNRECPSNGLDFAVSCNTCGDCENDNNCSDPGNPGMCTSETTGFCRQFGTCCGDTGCNFDANVDVIADPGTCVDRPNLISASINNNETGICPNSAITLSFDETISNIDTSTIHMENGQGDPVDIGVSVNGARVDITLNELMEGANGPYNLMLESDIDDDPFDATSIVSTSSGLPMDCNYNTSFGNCLNDDNGLYIRFETSGDACAPENLQITASSLTEEEVGQDNAFLFTEAGEEDNFSADVYAANGQAIQEVPGSYNWTYDWEPQFETVEQMQNTGCVWAGIITGTEGYEDDRPSQNITAGTVPEEQQPVLNTIEATITGDGTLGYTDTVDGSTTVAILECEGGNISSYHNGDYNFSLLYCLGTGDDELPDFLTNAVETTGGGVGENFQRQLLFTNNDNSDVIGMRIFGNNLDGNVNTVSDSVDPALWYSTQAENPISGSSSTEVAGYKAVKVGTTTYVAGSNIDGPGYTNIFLLSYNENSESSTSQIYEEILNNMLINDHIGNVYDPNNQSCSYNPEYVARDTQRVNGLGTTSYYLNNFRYSGLGSNNYPALTKGTYINSLTTSAWPSWSAKFGNDLGTGLPVDPINEFGTCDGDNYEAATCWNALDKLFMVPENSHIYLYRANNSGAGYGLYANLEYTGGPWATYSGDPCSSLGEVPEGCSGRFNYEVSE